MKKMTTTQIDQLPEQPYMNNDHLAYFKNKLTRQKIEVMEKMSALRNKLITMRADQPDILDRSNHMMEIEKKIQTQERHSILLRQIHNALERIDTGKFGYCEYTGDEIGIKRLEILPFTTLSVRAIEEFAS